MPSSGGWKSTASFHLVLLLPVRSAEPDKSSGTALCMLSRTFSDVFRVATAASVGFQLGRDFSHPSGSFLECRRARSAPASLCSLWYFLNSSFHFSSAAAPSAACFPYMSYTFSSTTKNSSGCETKFGLDLLDIVCGERVSRGQHQYLGS